MNKTQKIVATVIIVGLCVSIGLSVYMLRVKSEFGKLSSLPEELHSDNNNLTTRPIEKKCIPSPSDSSADVDTSDWEQYQNVEVGVTISYPNELIKKKFEVTPGYTGRGLYANFEFPSGKVLSVFSETKGYSAERDSYWGETHGYIEENGKYYIDEDRLLEFLPSDFWDINKGAGKAIVLYEKDFDKNLLGDFYAPELLVVVNNPNKTFPSIGFEINTFNASCPLSINEISIVRHMVSSLKFKK